MSDMESGRKDTEAEAIEKLHSIDLCSHTCGLVEEDKVEAKQVPIYGRGVAKYRRLGWKRLTILLIVEAVALGSLSLPGAFATLGMVAGVICVVGIGLTAMLTSYIIGQVKLKFPEVASYPDAGRLLGGRLGYEILNAGLVILLLLTIGSHCLVGIEALQNITQSEICGVDFGVVSAIILFLLAIPPSFADIAILGYIDFVSIILAIGITIIGTRIEYSSNIHWYARPKESTTFIEAFIAIDDIIFAYAFALCQLSFMDEMHTPED